MPTLPGLYAGFLTPPWLVIFMGLLGAVFGWLERWLLSECSPARLVMLAGVVIAALSYEEGLPGMLLAVRAAIVVAVAANVLGLARSRRGARGPESLAPRGDTHAPPAHLMSGPIEVGLAPDNPVSRSGSLLPR
jgi:hypothetical protein